MTHWYAFMTGSWVTIILDEGPTPWRAIGIILILLAWSDEIRHPPNA